MTDFLDYDGLSHFKEKLDGSINDYTTGINLLRGTRDFREGTTKHPDLSDTASYRTDGWNAMVNTEGVKTVDKEGFTIFTISSETDTVKAVYSSLIGGLFPGEYFTVSFEFMIEDVSNYKSENTLFRYDVFREGRSIGGTSFTAEDGGIKNPESGVLYKWRRSIMPNRITSPTDLLLASVRINRACTVHFRKVKIERGSINNPIWSASPFDVAQVSDIPSLPIPIDQGGTGATTAKEARTNLEVGQQFKFPLSTSNSYYHEFAVMPSGNTTLSGGAQFLVSGIGDFGNVYSGCYLVEIGNRGNTPSMRVTTLKPAGKTTFNFGYYIGDDSFFHFGYVTTSNYSPGAAFTVLHLSDQVTRVGVLERGTTIPTDIVYVEPTYLPVDTATPSETLAYIKGSTGSAVTTLPTEGVLVGALPAPDQSEDSDISTMPSLPEDRPIIGGLLKPDQDPDEIEGDDNPWQMM